MHDGEHGERPERLLMLFTSYLPSEPQGGAQMFFRLAVVAQVAIGIPDGVADSGLDQRLFRETSGDSTSSPVQRIADLQVSIRRSFERAFLPVDACLLQQIGRAS